MSLFPECEVSKKRDSKLRNRNSKEQYTCRCDAYRFPHRVLGGKCRGLFIAEEAWELNQGRRGVCGQCNLANTDTECYSYCEVLEGQERLIHCEAWLEFLADNNLKIPKRMQKRRW